MTMANYKLYVRDSNFNKVAEIDDYTKLDLTLNFNAVGAWSLELPTNCYAAYELIKPNAGIIVVRNGQTLFSGPATARNRKWSIDSDVLTITGVDDNIFLQRYLSYPVPSGPPYTSNDYDVRTGPAESIMKQYVDVNIGLSSSSNRKINITNEVDQGLGNVITGRARFQTLLDLFSSLAIAGGDLGFKVVQIGNGLQFQVYQPQDLSKSVIFSPLLGNLFDFEYNDTDPDTNYVLAGGTGEGTARLLLEQGDNNSISIYGRREEFMDKRDTSDPNEITQAIAEELTQKANQTSLSITPAETEAIQFGRDYNLGDIVSVVLTQPLEVVTVEQLNYFLSLYQTEQTDIELVKEIQTILEVITDVVRQLKISISRDGEVISPLVGTPDSLAHPVLGIFSKIKKMSKRLSNLERR
jgi:hypothetical protein